MEYFILLILSIFILGRSQPINTDTGLFLSSTSAKALKHNSESWANHLSTVGKDTFIFASFNRIILLSHDFVDLKSLTILQRELQQNYNRWTLTIFNVKFWYNSRSNDVPLADCALPILDLFQLSLRKTNSENNVETSGRNIQILLLPANHMLSQTLWN